MANIKSFILIFIVHAMFNPTPSEGQGIEIEDPTVIDHDVSDWDENNKKQELSEAVVDGLASTQMKRQLEVKPRTQILSFAFYKYVTEFLRKYVTGLRTVRLASVLVHYKPHTDACSGTVSFALVDQRYTDTMDVKPKINTNGIEKTKSKSDTVLGKIHQLVTVKCNMESIVQMSMNYFVTVEDLKKIRLVQIISGNNMVKGTLATINIGWKTVPGEATIYEPYHAQRYYIPRMKMPELVGKDDRYVYNSIVKMAKDRHNKEVQMLNKLQELIDGQTVINNDLDSDIKGQIQGISSKIDKYKDEIQKFNEIIPEKQKLIETQRELERLQKIREEKIKQFNDYDTELSKPSRDSVKINNRDETSKNTGYYSDF